MTYQLPVGFSQSTMIAANANFSGSLGALGSDPQLEGLQKNAQVWMGRTSLNPGGTNIDVVTLTAGSGITLTQTFNASGNTFTIASTGSSSVLTFTTVTHAQSPYTVLSTDQFLEVDTTGGAVTIKLPNAPTTGRSIIIKDYKGNSSTFAISVTTVGGTVTIDGQTTYTMASNWSSITVAFDSANYYIY